MPPEALAYQFKVPALAVAFKVSVPKPHRVLGVVAVMVGEAFTVAITAVRVEVQLPVVAST